ncbi:uncharacterized protein PHACADRAFT_194460 [Phanerochaete carnosa HHB-10118-sp]|uniref:Uncharacterized protein n=1 Tax=Phanerochaete carnosa (strain HHB-10118-sp) TaxID=650164 RepID=K5WD07_PHACS|nr:uncharacterized protein PHACADRAFT_194460 [Phanerochaete carnosa HHB-10118-sp]EKM56884.1 hypothetical protein PHACADRAFT_194460 [Phanerochaete carnosa HHB-10118-sp]
MDFLSFFTRPAGKIMITQQCSTRRFAPYSPSAKSRPDASTEPSHSSSETPKRRTAPLTRSNARYIDPTPMSCAPISGGNTSYDEIGIEAMNSIDDVYYDEGLHPRGPGWDNDYGSTGEPMYDSTNEDEAEGESGPYTPSSSWSMHDFNLDRDEALDQLYTKYSHGGRAEGEVARAQNEDQERRHNRTIESYSRKIQTPVTKHRNGRLEDEEARRREIVDIEAGFTRKLDKESQRAEKAMGEVRQWKLKAESANRAYETLRVETEAHLWRQDQARILAEAEAVRLHEELQGLRSSRPADEQADLRDRLLLYERK